LRHALHLLVSALILAATMPAAAGEFATLKDEIVTARQALVTMVLYRDKRGPEQQRTVKATADAVSARLTRLKAPEGRVAEFRELKSTWEAFKQTREKELVPAILVHDREKYELIGAGIQKQRLDRMYALLAVLDR
jgi:hypothetical protein